MYISSLQRVTRTTLLIVSIVRVHKMKLVVAVFSSLVFPQYLKIVSQLFMEHSYFRFFPNPFSSRGGGTVRLFGQNLPISN